MVQEKVVDKCNAADEDYFTLKVDGTKDVVGTENISIVLRFVQAGKVVEHLLNIYNTVALHANAITDVIIIDAGKCSIRSSKDYQSML